MKKVTILGWYREHCLTKCQYDLKCLTSSCQLCQLETRKFKQQTENSKHSIQKVLRRKRNTRRKYGLPGDGWVTSLVLVFTSCWLFGVFPGLRRIGFFRGLSLVSGGLLVPGLRRTWCIGGVLLFLDLRRHRPSEAWPLEDMVPREPLVNVSSYKHGSSPLPMRFYKMPDSAW